MEISRVRSTSLHRGADGAGAVHARSSSLMAGGHGGLQLRQQGPDAVDGLDDVGARLAEDDDHDGGLAVDQAGVAQVLHRVRRPSATSASRTAAPLLVGDDQRARTPRP